MTDSDERLLTAAKLNEIGESRHGDSRLLEATGVLPDERKRQVSTWLEQAFGDEWTESELNEFVMPRAVTDTATDSLLDDQDGLLSFLVGVTERDLDASSLTVPLRILERMENNGAPSLFLVAGNPETGKTGLVLTLAEMWSIHRDDALIISNMKSSLTDRRVTSAHDLALALLEERERSKVVVLDEASTHLDARTNRREVATQFTPLARHFSKLGVDFFAALLHSGKDVHPEAKRMATTSVIKEEKSAAEFFDRWPADADAPTDPVFSGTLENVEPPNPDYDPDAAAPWSWNLRHELFSKALDWPELLEQLKERGPLHD